MTGNAQHLLIAFLDPIVGENIFDELTFAITGYSGGSRYLNFSRKFSSVDQASIDEALGFFGDNTVDLGEWLPSFVPDLLRVDVAMTATMSKPNSFFSVDFILGNSTIGSGPEVMPEPPTLLLLLLPTAFLLAWRRYASH